MRIFRYELRKLSGCRSFIFIVTACWIMYTVYSFHSIYSGEKKPSEYRVFFSSISDLSDEQTSTYIDNNLKSTFSGNGKYSSSTIYPLSEQYKRITDYPNYLKNINEQCDNITKVSIFADKGSYAYKNAQKTKSAYNNVKVESLPFDISDGVEAAIINKIADILIVFIIFAAAVFIFTKDKEIGVMNLIYSYPKGRTHLCISKIAVLLTVTILVNLLFLTSGIIIGISTFGLGDLNRPIQSVNGFLECNLNLCVWQYILLHFFMKVLSCFVIGLAFSLICHIASNNVVIYCFSAAILYVEYKLYIVYSSVSEKALLHELNIFSFIKPESYFARYRNININNEPFNVAAVAIIICLTAMLFLSSVLTIVFANFRRTVFKRFSLNWALRSKHKVHSRFYYELKKIFVLQGGIWIAIIWIIIIVGYHCSFTKPASSVDMYYKKYTTENIGAISQNTVQVITDDEEYFAAIDERSASRELTITERYELEAEQNHKEAFIKFKSRCDAIKDRNNTIIFYDSGYIRAFGAEGKRERLQMTLLIMIVSVLLVSSMIANDKSKGMTTIIYSTKSGKVAYLKRNAIIAAMIGCIASFTTYIPYFFNILDKYGIQGLNAQMNSLTDYSTKLKIWQYALIVFLFRMLVHIIINLIMLIVSYHSKSKITPVIINATLFVMPVLIIIASGN